MRHILILTNIYFSHKLHKPLLTVPKTRSLTLILKKDNIQTNTLHLNFYKFTMYSIKTAFLLSVNLDCQKYKI